MRSTWVVVAHRAGARILEHRGPGKGLSLLRELDHAQGRLKSSEINTDRPGRSLDRGGLGGRHPMGTEVSAHDHVASVFARELAALITAGRSENQFRDVVLVAEPRFLGLLRGALDGVSAGMVSATVGKDLAQVPVRDLAPHLAPVLAV